MISHEAVAYEKTIITMHTIIIHISIVFPCYTHIITDTKYIVAYMEES